MVAAHVLGKRHVRAEKGYAVALLGVLGSAGTGPYKKTRVPTGGVRWGRMGLGCGVSHGNRAMMAVVMVRPERTLVLAARKQETAAVATAAGGSGRKLSNARRMQNRISTPAFDIALAVLPLWSNECTCRDR